MRRSFSLLRGSLVSAVLFALCIPVFTQSSKSVTDYWPMKKGNFWKLSAKAQGKAMAPQEMKVTEVKPAEDKNGTLAILNYVQNGKSIQQETYRITKDTISREAGGPDGNSRISPPIPIIKLPMKAGQTWKWEGVIETMGQSFQGTSTLTVSGPLPVKTPAGSFKAMKVTSVLKINAGGQMVALPNSYWFAPGVGLVQQTATLGKLKMDSDLLSYKLKK